MKKSLLLTVLFLFAGMSVWAQSTITLGTGTSAASTNALFSTSTTSNKYSRTIAIYTAAEIAAAGGLPGLITKLAWNKSGTGEYTASDIQLAIYMKHVTYAIHPVDPVDWATEATGTTQVYNSSTTSFPTGTGWKDFIFTTPFLWNGTDNLEVFVDFYRPGTPTGSINWGYTAVTKGGTATQVNSNPIPTVRLATNRPNMQLTFAPTAANDAGIIAITAPVSACGLSNQESVTVTIRNLGSNTLTSIPVTYSVNGTPIPAPETFTGSLNSGASATYTFTAKANLAAAGPYTIQASTALPGDANAANNATTVTVTNSLSAGLPQLNFETPATGIGAMRIVTNARSAVTEGAGASNGSGSTKGLIMDGVNHTGWTLPTTGINAWASNPDHFSSATICFSPAGGNPNDPLFLVFDLKQLYKGANVNTNFRVMVNGTQVGPTYNPPFDPNNPATPIVWRRISVDLTSYKNLPGIEISLESSVKEEYANGAGTANLIDNLEVIRANPSGTTGLKDDVLQAKLSVFPNPSAGIFNVSLAQGKALELEVTDLSGKVVMKQSTKANNGRLDLSKAAKGIYLLKVMAEGTFSVRKIVVE
ncbi:T9SS type A sorting domain-containing protein [Adhaeribacter soli]|uniref:T9SS type A sorting domain-containing protein n=1 Tax=Adhaeribacter soli TaxID=2607655 RepID=A0A5N1IV20_9BACT|nr:T9SS type A sorting domain-containing protein [Adhaeribacter soli]KAA9333617.1 T9SS type A sorting domain-containing protein [Adhaeribacter soli]